MIACPLPGHHPRADLDNDTYIVAPEIARTIATREGTSQDWETTTMVAHSLRADGFDASEDGTERGTPLVHCHVMPTMMNGANTPAGHSARSGHSKDSYIVAETVRSHPRPGSNSLGAIAFTQNSRSEVREVGGDGQIVGALAAEPGAQQQNYIAFGAQNSARQGASASVTPTLDKSKVPGVGGETMRVRRLTPRECERLQGFRDDYTLLPYGAKRKTLDEEEYRYLRATYPDMAATEAMRLARDGPRYKALGNSMAVPVVRWIGERIAEVDTL